MAYTHNTYEVMLPFNLASAFTASGQFDHDLTQASTIVLGRWAPAITPHIVKGAAAVITVNSASDITAGAVRIAHEKPVGTGTTSATQIALLTFPTTLGIATTPVVYQLVTGSVKVNPGEGVRAHMGTVATTGIRGYVVLYVEQTWETPANLAMIRTT